MQPFTGLDFLSAGELAWCTAVVIAGGFVGGVMGFGFPLVMMPLLTPVLGLKPALLIGVLPTISLTLFGMLAGGNLRASIGRFWFMPLGMPIGTWFGTQTLIRADPRPFVLALALALLAYLNMERLGKNDLPFVRRHAALFGVVAALVGGWFEAVVNVAAPIMLIYFMLVRLDPRSLVQALENAVIDTMADSISRRQPTERIPDPTQEVFAQFPW